MVSSVSLSETVKEIDLPSTKIDKVIRLHASPVVSLEAHIDPVRPSVRWDNVPTKTGQTADPAAGANPAAFGPPAGRMWKITSIYVQNVASAVAANRRPYVVVLDENGRPMGASAALTVQLASTTVNWAGAPFIQGQTQISLDPSVTVLVIPDAELMPGQTMQLLVGALDGGDDLGALTYGYKEIAI